MSYSSCRYWFYRCYRSYCIHSHTAYKKPWGWDAVDYGPSSTDMFLFGIAGIFRQFIANEQGVLYEFFEDESIKEIYTFC